jgi:hypothetical protein
MRIPTENALRAAMGKEVPSVVGFGGGAVVSVVAVLGTKWRTATTE